MSEASTRTREVRGGREIKPSCFSLPHPGISLFTPNALQAESVVVALSLKAAVLKLLVLGKRW